MPTYDYVCDACEHQFELFQSMKDDPKKQCPECGKKKLRRLIGTGLAIVFKGSGFYTTDYRSESYKKAAAADKSASSSSSSEKSSVAEKATPAEKSGAAEKSSPAEKSSESVGGKKGKSGKK